MDNRRRMMLATLGGGIPLSDLPVGSILKILEGGVLTDFYVSKHNYESGLNGAGRTLLVRKDCYDIRIWDSNYHNAYASSTIDSWLNSTYKSLLDADVKKAISTTKFYYTPGGGNTTMTTLSRDIFLLSVMELYGTLGTANAEGSKLPINLRPVYLNGSKVEQWTRSPDLKADGNVHYITFNGSVNNHQPGIGEYGSRPAFTLPTETPCELNADGTYTLLL